jgi:hypothetical protein
MLKLSAVTFAIAFAAASYATVAQATHQRKARHAVSRHAKPATSERMPSRSDCPIPGMGTANRFGVDNDTNVYRNKPFCY